MNTSTSNNKVAIITGSSRGIGAAIAKRLAADGIAVIVNYAGRTADAEAVVSEIQENGGRAAAFQADVSVPAQVAAMFDQAITLFSGVDMLINTAGIMQPGPCLPGRHGRRPLRQTGRHQSQGDLQYFADCRQQASRRRAHRQFFQ